MVVGDPELVKVHVHTNSPGVALQYALELGELDRVKIENMVQQHREIVEKRAQSLKETGVVAIASGDGLAGIFKELGVDAVVTGGQTMNPSTEDISEAVKKVNAKNVIVLPHNLCQNANPPQYTHCPKIPPEICRKIQKNLLTQ